MRSGRMTPILAFLVVLALCLSACTAQNAAEANLMETSFRETSPNTSPPQETADLANLFSRVLTSDGAATEALASELSQAFQADTEGFLTAVSQESGEIIDMVAMLVAYDLPGVDALTSLLDSCRNRADLAWVIQRFDDWNKTIPIASAEPETAVPAPTIGAMAYSSSAMEAGIPQTLRVVLSEESRSDTLRQWWAEIYSVADGESICISSGYVSIEAGSTETDAVFFVTFQEPGTVYTMVQLFDCEGGNLLASRTGRYPDSVY